MTSISNEIHLPVTERANNLSTSIDVASSINMIRILRQCDQQIFTGYLDYPCLSDAAIHLKIKSSIQTVVNVLSTTDGKVVMSGSGTSGRLGMLIARDLNASLLQSGMVSMDSLPFGYTISGGDAAILLSDELPEDDPITAVHDLHNCTLNNSNVCLIGITCGLSAPYVAGQVDYILDTIEQAEGTTKDNETRYSTIMMGFNPDVLAREKPIELWKHRQQENKKNDNKKKKSMSVRDVVLRLHAMEKQQQLESLESKAVLLNPVVGPESICASSRMKGGSITKILLDIVLTIACKQVYGMKYNQELKFHSSKMSTNASISTESISVIQSSTPLTVLEEIATTVSMYDSVSDSKNNYFYSFILSFNCLLFFKVFEKS